MRLLTGRALSFSPWVTGAAMALAQLAAEAEDGTAAVGRALGMAVQVETRVCAHGIRHLWR
jgi:hypothetical protein